MKKSVQSLSALGAQPASVLLGCQHRDPPPLGTARYHVDSHLERYSECFFSLVKCWGLVYLFIFFVLLLALRNLKVFQEHHLCFRPSFGWAGSESAGQPWRATALPDALSAAAGPSGKLVGVSQGKGGRMMCLSSHPLDLLGWFSSRAVYVLLWSTHRFIKV